MLADRIRMLLGQLIPVGDHPLAGRFRLGVHADVVHEIEAVLLDVGQDPRQALVLDFALVLAGAVLLNGDRDRDAEQDHEELDQVVQLAAHPLAFRFRYGRKLGHEKTRLRPGFSQSLKGANRPLITSSTRSRR